MTQVKGIGDDAPEGWVLEEYEVPMPKGLRSILEAVRNVLELGKVQSVHLEMGRPIVFTRLVKESEAEEKRQIEKAGDATLGDMARNILMEEYSGRMTKPFAIFFDMLLALSARRLHLTHIGVGPETRLFEWLGIDPIAYGGITYFAGAEVVRDGSLPDDSLIFFSGRRAGGRIDQSTFALRCHMLTSEDLEQEDDNGQELKNHGSGNSPQGSSLADGAVAHDSGGVVGESGGGGPKKGRSTQIRDRSKPAADAQGKHPGHR